jgi:hypothetical protein
LQSLFLPRPFHPTPSPPTPSHPLSLSLSLSLSLAVFTFYPLRAQGWRHWDCSFICVYSLCKLRLSAIRYLGDQVEENGLGGASSTRVEMTIAEKNLVGNPENRRFCRRGYRRIEFSTRSNGSTRLGASLPKDGSRTGFRNVVF